MIFQDMMVLKAIGEIPLLERPTWY